MNEEKMHIVARQRLGDYLKAHGKRQTYERYAILDKVMGTPGHFTVEAFHASMSDAGERFSLATVYNTFEVLCDAGLLRRHTFDHNTAEYERVAVGGQNANHTHLICTDCGAVREVRNTTPDDILGRTHFPRFQAAYVSMYVYGLCSRCARRRRNGKDTALRE